MFTSINDVKERLEKQEYITSTNVATVVYLATQMRKPILVEGPAGVGKTELAKVMAMAQDLPLIRLQCYEGLDEAKALYEWEYSKQLLYTQILKDKISETMHDVKTLADAVDRIAQEKNVFFSEHFLLPRPLLHVITSDQLNVLLIDEVDKADSEFEAFLLEVLSDFQVSIPEIGTMTAKHIPQVILTSNNTRELSDALKRRCLHLYIDYPTYEQELKIVQTKVPHVTRALAEEVVKLVESLRNMDLKKAPSISETLDWVRALAILNAETLDQEIVENTLNLVLKYENDIQTAQAELAQLLAEKKAPEVVPVVPAKEGILH